MEKRDRTVLIVGHSVNAQVVEDIRKMEVMLASPSIDLKEIKIGLRPYPSEHGEIRPLIEKKRDRVHTLYKILDKDDVEMPRHHSGRGRSFSEAFKLIIRLNKNGENRPYRMEPLSE